MWKNYFKIAWRNLGKNRMTSFVNITGLAIGMAVAILIGLWIWDELSFDKYNENYDHIAQIARKETTNGEIHISSNSNYLPIPLAGELRNSYGQYFKEIALASTNREHILLFNEHKLTSQGMYVEPGFTSIFTLKMKQGSLAGFNNTNSILINQSLASSLFDKGDPIGKMIKLNNNMTVSVAGVFENLPDNSHFSGTSFFCPWALLLASNQGVKKDETNWENSSFHIYVKTAPGASLTQISQATEDVYWNRIKDKSANVNSRNTTFLHPMKDWHLRSEWINGKQAGGRIQLVWLFGIIGIFVLLLACINFMNLSTARSEKRAREVGIRKSVGSLRGQLVWQFLGESFVVVCIAYLLSIGLVVGWVKLVQ
jgi:putative ABC transport system permease protein